MTANELIARAIDICRRSGRPFPTELKGYASDWQRQQYDLAWCWGTVQSALRQGRALCNVEAEVHRHHARLQAEKDARDLRAGEPSVTIPAPGREPWCDLQSTPDDVPSPASAGGFPDDPDGLLPCAEPRQTHPAPQQQPIPVRDKISPRQPDCRKKPRQSRRRRDDTLTEERQVWLRQQFASAKVWPSLQLEEITRKLGWLKPSEAISQNSPFQDARRALGIKIRRRGFGRGARYEWFLPTLPEPRKISIDCGRPSMS
jgi:hypothetical protein